MNHARIYNMIIVKARQENRKKKQGIYYEKHHIMPKSLFPLLEKDTLNLVLLTAREHYFCHQLLTKMYKTPQMIYALWRLSNDRQNRYCIRNSREYQRIKEQFAIINGLKTKERLTGYKHSNESKKRMSEARLGIKFSENHKKNLSEAAINKFKNKEFQVKFSKIMKNKFKKYGPAHTQKHSEETKKKIKEKIKGLRWWTNGTISLYRKECPDGFYSGRIMKNSSKNKLL